MTLYEKRGRKYYPVRDSEGYNGLENGCWLVMVENGCTTVKKAVEPATAALQFATLMASNKVAKFLAKASEAKPSVTKYTKKQEEAFEIIKKMLPDEDKFFYWNYDSMNGMAEKIVDLILENYNENKR